MDSASYINLQQSLAEATQDIQPEEFLDDIVNDKARFLKNTLEGVGSNLAGHSILKGLGEKAKKSLNLSDEEYTALKKSISDGDYEGATGRVFKGVIKKASSKLENTVNQVSKGDIPKSRADLSKAARRALRKAKKIAKRQQEESGPAETSEDDIRTAIQKKLSGIKPLRGRAVELDPLEGPSASALGKLPLKPGASIEDVLKEQYSSARNILGNEGKLATQGGRPFGQDTPIQDRPRGAYGGADNEPLLASQPPEGVLASGNKLVDDTIDNQAEKAVVGGIEKKTVKAGLEEATEASLAEDENPIGIIATAGLGIATLVAGLFTHDHKKEFVKPPIQAPSINYSMQSGVV